MKNVHSFQIFVHPLGIAADEGAARDAKLGMGHCQAAMQQVKETEAGKGGSRHGLAALVLPKWHSWGLTACFVVILCVPLRITETA